MTMAVRKIIRMGHPQLREVANDVAPEMIGSTALSTLVEDMVETLHDYGGIGLAAPQINEPLRLAIIDIPGGPSRYGDIEAVPLTVFINPVITIEDPAAAGYWEGCLSIPGLRGYVERPQHVTVAYSDLNGAACSLTLKGFSATCLQHEFDHLNGRLYVDLITDPSKLVFEEEYLRYWT